MTIRPLDGLPKISSDPSSQLAFYAGESGRVILILEAHRDFLSAPKSFVEIRAQLGDDGAVCTGGAFLSDEEHSHLMASDYGCYCLTGGEQSNSGGPAEPSRRHVIFYAPNLTVELLSTELILHKTHLHQLSCKTVLAQILSGCEAI